MERVAGGDAGAGHVNKFGMGADLISVAGFGCSGSDRRCVLVHRPVFRLGPGGVPGQCVSARTWSGARLRVACVGVDSTHNSQLTRSIFAHKAGARGARQALKALTLSHKQSPLCILYSRAQSSHVDGGKLIFKR